MKTTTSKLAAVIVLTGSLFVAQGALADCDISSMNGANDVTLDASGFTSLTSSDTVKSDVAKPTTVASLDANTITAAPASDNQADFDPTQITAATDFDSK